MKIGILMHLTLTKVNKNDSIFYPFLEPLQFENSYKIRLGFRFLLTIYYGYRSRAAVNDYDLL